MTKTYAWAPDDMSSVRNIFPEMNFAAFRGKSPVEVFEMFMTEEIINFLANESTKFAAFMNEPSVIIAPENIRDFIAVLILSGYCCLPGKEYFWESGDDVRNTLVYNAIHRDKFRNTMRFFSLCR